MILGKNIKMPFWQSPPDQRLSRLLLLMACGVAVAKLLLAAWVGDDAFITFRMVDNVIHGYGLRWNVHERVQACTNPLWMLLHIPFYAVWPNAYLLTLAISFVTTVASVAVAAKTFMKSPATVAFCLILPLLFARPWLEYAMSGLENPLSYLLFSAFGWALMRGHESRRWFWLSLTVALAMLNRLDTALIYLPAFGWQIAKNRWETAWRQVACGFLPLLAWLAFSLFYYGFFFPNTKYAKLNTGIAWVDYWRQGMFYAYDLLGNHTPAGTTLLAGLALGGWCGWQFFRGRVGADRQGVLCSVALGIFAYSLYIIAIGGDFMSGRFFALPVFMSVWLFYAVALPRLPLIYGGLILIGLFALQMLPGHIIPALRTCPNCYYQGIADEREFYRDNIFINTANASLRLDAQNGWADEGRRLRSSPPQEPMTAMNMGMLPYFAGPKLVVVDTFALTDPLLARLPVQNPHSWRIGHFQRTIPKGYLYAIRTGSTAQMDANLAHYYDKLRLIVSGNVWDWERIETILYFHLGAYDHWKQAYLEQPLP